MQFTVTFHKCVNLFYGYTDEQVAPQISVLSESLGVIKRKANRTAKEAGYQRKVTAWYPNDKGLCKVFTDGNDNYALAILVQS